MQCRGAKSFVDDLGLSRGVVFSRAVALLRSIETKPPDSMICPLWTGISSAWLVSLLASVGRSVSPPVGGPGDQLALVGLISVREVSHLQL